MNYQDELKGMWEIWCEQAATKAGISVDELKKRLCEDDNACLEISAVISTIASTKTGEEK